MMVKGLVCALLVVGICSGAAAQTPKEAAGPAECAAFDADTGIRFGLAGFCAKVSGALQGIYQNDLSTSASGIPAALSGNSSPATQPDIYTGKATASFDARRQTALGLFDTGLSVQWLKASNDGTDAGTVSITELKASLAGATVGYTSSLMDFWAEDFLFLAATTSRTAGLISYEHSLTHDLKLAVALESGLPTSRQDTEGLRSIDFSSPILTTRLLYTPSDGQAYQLAGLLRRADNQTNPVLASQPSTETARTGWALTAGATVPTAFIDAKDYVSAQAVYAVDASYFLGTKVDLAALTSILPNSPPTKGWSIVASFHHQWSERWEMNIFASYLSLDVDAMIATPTVRTKRLWPAPCSDTSP